MLKLSEISLKRAPIFSPILTLNRENPVKLAFSVPVENALNNRSVYQNTEDLHLTQCLLMALATEAVFATYYYPYYPTKPCQNTNVKVIFSGEG